MVTPDGNGGYDLTAIEEEDTPLADMELESHKCCIMHFLLMLIALIILGFYTRSRKKHQEKIHELREELELEKQKRGLTGTDAATAAGNGRE